MKKWMLLLLCICFLLPTLSACVGGDKGDGTTDTGISDGISADGLVIVYADKTSAAVNEEIGVLREVLEDVFGTTVTIESEKKHTAEENKEKTELLIGSTSRDASQSAKGKMPQKGYVICAENGSIAINGTNDAMLLYAIRLFADRFVRACEGDRLEIPKDLLLKNTDEDVITLVENGVTQYSLAYASTCDSMPNNGSVNDGLDCEVVLLKELQTALFDATNVRFEDTSSAGVATTKPEILIGDSGRTEFELAKKQWSVDQYGVAVVGNKLVLGGWSDVTVEKAVEAFKVLVKHGKTTEGGKTSVSFIKDHFAVCQADGWITDIPEYEGGVLSGCNDAAYGQLLYRYTETSAKEFEAYCAKLEAEGYQKKLSNANGNNLYATYVKGDVKLHAYYTDCEKAVRLITGDVKVTGLVKDDVTGEAKVTDFSVTQMNLTYPKNTSGGMGYVMTLEDGRFVIVDGGRADALDAARLYALLQRLNKRSDGIKIAGWILTHEHSDHFGVFKQFVNTYGSLVEIQNFYVSIPSESYRFNSGNPGAFMSEQFPSLAKNAGEIPLTVLHTGQKFLIGNASFEILYTTEDLYPQPFDVFNDASVVFRVTANGGSVLFLGDCAQRTSGILCDMYGSYLKSDLVQVAHHGWDGATLEVYQNVSPKAVMWPNSKSEYDACVASLKWFGDVNRSIVNVLVGKEKVYIADTYCYQFTLPLVGSPNQFTVS